MIITIIAFVIVFGVLVTVHEFGHYYVAKRSGILVREFSIGMGPKLFAYRKNGTTYTIRILPLGGYVRMAGLDDEDALQNGMAALLTTDDDEVVRTIDLRRDHPSLTGLPLEVTDWDLQDKLWIEGMKPVPAKRCTGLRLRAMRRWLNRTARRCRLRRGTFSTSR